MYPDVHLLVSKLITIGEVQVTMKDPRTLQKLTFFSSPLTKLGLLLIVYFSSTSDMASSKTTSQAPQGRSLGLFTNFHEDNTATQPPSQLEGHPPRVTISWSLTQTTHNGELNTYIRIQKKHQGCSNPSLSNPTNATNARIN
jgi:hypothetical protein